MQELSHNQDNEGAKFKEILSWAIYVTDLILNHL